MLALHYPTFFNTFASKIGCSYRNHEPLRLMREKLENVIQYLRKHVGSSLGIIISAAILVELTGIIQYYYTRNILRNELEKHAVAELSSKADMIASTLMTAEITLNEHMWDIQSHLSQPDSMFNVTRRLIEINPIVVGGCIGFSPYYYPSKGRLFEPYATEENDKIVVSQLASSTHDYTQHPAFITAATERRQLWSDPYVYGTDSMRLTTFSCPIIDANDSVAGVCGLDIDLTWLSDTINDMRYYPSSFGMLLDKDGVLVVGPPEEHASKRVVDHIISLINDSTVERRLSKNGESTIINFKTPHSGNKACVYYMPISKDPHWQVALVNYDKEVYEPLYRNRLRNMLLMVSALLVLFYIVRRFAGNERRLHEVGIKQTRIDSELHIASAIQQTMLPKTFPPFPERNDIDIYGSLVPAKEVGGDLFDFYIRDEKLFFCIGDVSGKGVPSAIVMAVMQKLFRITSAHTSNPANIVQAINQELCNNNERNMFMTFFIGILDLPSGRLRFCNAGHETPLILSEDAGCVTLSELPVKSNLPIGVFADFTFEKEECQLPVNSTFFLYTDGLTEALNAQREQFRLNRIKEVLSQCTPDEAKNTERLINVMSDAVNKFTGNTEQSDDLTMLAIRYQRLTENDVLCDRFVLQNDLRQIRPLNDFVKEFLERFGVEKSLARRLQLAVEEVVTNVVSYAYSPGTTGDISVEAFANERRLKFIISDEGVAFDPTTVANADTSLAIEDRPIGGLGILLTRGLVDSVNYERLNGRNVLTLRKNIHADQP